MPDQWWAVVAQLGFWGWILAVSGLILHAFPARGVFNRRPAALWGAAFLVLYAIWIIGMLRA